MKKSELEKLKQLLEKYSEVSNSAEAGKLLEQLRSASPQKKIAGRKRKYSDETIKAICALYLSGTSIRRIAEITGCSVGYVHSHLKGHNPKIT